MREAVAPYLKARIDERTEKGVQTYGEPLTTFNGRDPREDAFQELLDLVQYQEQVIQELRARVKELEDGSDTDE